MVRAMMRLYEGEKPQLLVSLCSEIISFPTVDNPWRLSEHTYTHTSQGFVHIKLFPRFN